MMTLRPSGDRGHANHGWLDARHSFSFADYYDPKWMGFSSLRVINEDRVAKIAGFPPHSHRDMEIITYVLDGTLRHQDSTGGQGDLRHGELQVMHAGRGVTHSEVNPSASDSTHLLQIWIEPRVKGVPAAYEQGPLDAAALHGGFVKVVAPQGEAAPFNVHADARLLLAWPRKDQQVEQALDSRRHYYLHVAVGSAEVNGKTLEAGDAVMLSGESKLALTAREDAEVLLFDLT